MRKKYNVLFLTAAVFIFIFAVFYPPVRSIADQGDFERVMRPMGLDFPDGYSFYSYAERFFTTRFTRADLFLYVPRLLFLLPSTSFVFPSFIARILSFGAFDVRVLAVIMFIWYTLSCFFILRKVEIENPILRIIFIAVFLVMFYNGVNLTMFNSLYGQSVMLAAFASLVASGIYLFEDVKSASAVKLITFAVTSCLLIGAKLQCFVFAPFLIAAVIYAGVKSDRLTLSLVLTVVIAWHGVGGYFINGINTSNGTLYNSVFYGILKDSPTPEKDLEALRLDAGLAADASKHAYMDASEYRYPPDGEEIKDIFYSKISNLTIMKFYLTHPKRLYNAMETTANNAFRNRIDLGTFEKKYGFEPYTSDYRFTLWEDIRSRLPKTLLFIVPVWSMFIVFAFVMRGKSYFLPLLIVFCMGALQFPMPYIGNGAADISKQLFLFNIVFDFGIAVFVYSALKGIDKFFKKRY